MPSFGTPDLGLVDASDGKPLKLPSYEQLSAAMNGLNSARLASGQTHERESAETTV
jgi:hypothetical protein